MKLSKMHNYAKNPIFLGMMILAILGVTISPSYARASAAKSYNGEDLFKAIYFLDGDLVEQIPALKNLKSKMDTALDNVDMSEIYQDVLSDIKKENPTFLQELESAVRSDNHYLISNKIKEGGELIFITSAKNGALSKQPSFPDLSKYDLSNETERKKAYEDLNDYVSKDLDIDTGKPDHQACLAYGLLAVVVVGLIALVMIIVGVFKYITGLETITNNNISEVLSAETLFHEKIVGDLVSL